MRTLNLNKVSVWHCKYLGAIRLKDGGGRYSGETRNLYTTPTEMHLNLYSADSDIVRNTFGTTNNINLMCADKKGKLKMSDKLFYNKPELHEDIDEIFDLEVTGIAESLNHTNYGFRRTIK